MQFPASTGQVARFLGVTEPRLNDLVRREKIVPPPVSAGRRLWDLVHVQDAARELCLPIPSIEGDLLVSGSTPEPSAEQAVAQ